jgi:hypothetical protein
MRCGFMLSGGDDSVCEQVMWAEKIQTSTGAARAGGERMEKIGPEALTFDDVLHVPR